MEHASDSWVVAAAMLCGAALAGCGSSGAAAPGSHRGPASPAAASPAASSPAASPPPAPALRSRAGWRLDPDHALPRHSAWPPVLAVARRFARADLSYEVGEVGPAVRAAITGTCTTAFAAGLLRHRATLPPGVTPGQVRQRLTRVTPLERLPTAAVVLVTVRPVRHPGGSPGAFELRLVPRRDGWRVTALSVV